MNKINTYLNKAKIATAVILTSAAMSSCGGPKTYDVEGTNLQGEKISMSYDRRHKRMDAIIENDSNIKYIYGNVKADKIGSIDTIIWDQAVKEIKQTDEMFEYDRNKLTSEQTEKIQNEFWNAYKTVRNLFGTKIADETKSENPNW
jgi:hypothetical protein